MVWTRAAKFEKIHTPKNPRTNKSNSHAFESRKKFLQLLKRIGSHVCKERNLDSIFIVHLLPTQTQKKSYGFIGLYREYHTLQ